MINASNIPQMIPEEREEEICSPSRMSLIIPIEAFAAKSSNNKVDL